MRERLLTLAVGERHVMDAQDLHSDPPFGSP